MTVMDPCEPLSGSVEVLYAVYLAIARHDHRCRVRALYGDQAPPPGHTPFRPLPMKHFQTRFEISCAAAGGERAFRMQLARWAKVYGVDCLDVVSRRMAA
jgi:hypothetical protein